MKAPAAERYPNATSYFTTDSPENGTLALELVDMQHEIDMLRAGLEVLAAGGCSTFWARSELPPSFLCIPYGRTARAEYGADRACMACIANEILHGRELT